MMKGSEKKVDLRIRRTYKLLVDSLMSLLEEKSFEKISVKDICDRAMVHRTTFYKYFEDKYYLLRYIIKDIQKNISKKSLSNIGYSNLQEYYMEILKNILKYVSDNKKIYSLMLPKNNYDSIFNILYKLMADEMISKLEYNKTQGVKPQIPISIISHFYTGAIISLTYWWIDNNMPITIEELVEYVNIMINPSLAKTKVE